MNLVSLLIQKNEFILFRPKYSNQDPNFELERNQTAIIESTIIKYLGVLLGSKQDRSNFVTCGGEGGHLTEVVCEA